MDFLVIMLGAFALALIAGWLTWWRDDKARQDAQLRQDEVALAEQRLAERARRLRSKDRR